MNGSMGGARAPAQDEKYYMPFQYGNPANPLAHQEGTAQEIIRDLPEVTHFVGGMGTGGTLTGNGRGSHAHNPDVTIVAAEPELGDLVYGLRSLDAGFIPPIFDPSEIDRKFLVDSRRRCARTASSPRARASSPASRAEPWSTSPSASRARSTRATSCACCPTAVEVPVDRGLGRGPRDGREGRRGSRCGGERPYRRRRGPGA